MAETQNTSDAATEVMAGDVSSLPPAAKAVQVAELLQTSEAALAQDRYMKRGLPFVRVGGRIRYMRSDVVRYLTDHRHVPGDAA